MIFKETRYGVCSPGFRAAGVKRGRYGVSLVVADQVCETAAVFTRNSVKAGSLRYTKAMVRNGVAAVVANSGNANCCVPTGVDDARELAEAAAKALGVNARNVAVASTGIIGRRMDVDAVKSVLSEAACGLAPSPQGSLQAAKAIMTTDTRIKMYSAESKGIRVGGICKGAGMIAPNMATMLCFITTNAALPKGMLQKALGESCDETFNMVSVDGDMSTNDTVLLMSNRTARAGYGTFKPLLSHVMAELAKMIARDGEGASKFIEVEVRGARSVADARAAVLAVSNSPLVKTAFYGENPNWGRIVAAIGARIEIDDTRVDVTYSAQGRAAKLLLAGRPMNPEPARKVLAARAVKVEVDLHLGACSAVGWTCDMTPEYVKINAGYN